MINFYIHQFWNILYLCYIIYQIKNTDTITDTQINNLKDKINNSGVFAIKLVQWSEAKFRIIYGDDIKYKKLLDNLQIYYEKCNIHSYEKTKNIFYNEFKEKLEVSIKLDSTIPIASGSIGQVYKGILKKTNTPIAIKCVHPTIYNEIKLPYLLFTFYSKYLTKLPFMNSYTLPFDTSRFFIDLEKQMNMLHEVKNMEKMHHIYKNNPYIIIPKPIMTSKNILVMTFENGSSFENAPLSEYKKSKVATLFKLFNLNNYCISGFTHGDIHLGNWKINDQPLKGLHPIIILDFGLCFEYSTSFIQNFINVLDAENIEKIEFLFFNKDAIKYNPHDNKTTILIKNRITKNIKEKINICQNVSITEIQQILPFIVKENIILSSIFLNFFIGFILIHNITKKNTENAANYKEKNITENNRFKIQYPALISFCKTYNIFNDYKNIIEIEVNNFIKNNEIEIFESAKNIINFEKNK